jgi:hypothetical protein
MLFPTDNRPGSHVLGDFYSNVESSHGVRLSGGSTGGVVDPAGDDANISLSVTGKGTGAVKIGNSSSPVSINGAATLGNTVISSGNTLQVNSTAPFAGFVRQESTAVATPNFSSTGNMTVVSTVTMAGINSSCFIIANAINLSNGVTIDAFAGSTAGSINIRWNKTSTVVIGASTATIRFLATRF